MRKFNFSEFEKIVHDCTFSASLFDFCALHSCSVNRELLFLRLRQMLLLENRSFSFINVVIDKPDSCALDYAVLLRFLRVYYDVTSCDYPVFLNSFNSFYGCDLNLSDLDKKTPELF